MKRLNVLYLIDKLEIAGAQRHLVALLRGIDKDRFEPSVVCLMHEGPLAEEIRSLGIPVEALHVKRIYGLSGMAGLVKLIRILKKDRIDVVHSYLFSENILGTVAARLAGIRMIVTGRRDTGKLREGKRRHLFLYRLTNRWVDRIVCVSEAVKRLVMEREGASQEKLVTIPNGVQVEPLLSPEKTAELREEWGVSRGTLLVTIVANLSWIKGHDVFLKAARIVKREIPKSVSG